MEGVLVSAKLAGSNKTVTVVSDAKGRYAFPANRLEPGSYAVTIRAIGYDLATPSTPEVSAKGGATADLKLVKTKDLAAVCVLFAAGIGLSRVYLSQHFTEDVLAGATIGTMVTYLVYRWLYTAPFSKRPWLDRSLLRGQNQ